MCLCKLCIGKLTMVITSVKELQWKYIQLFLLKLKFFLINNKNPITRHANCLILNKSSYWVYQLFKFGCGTWRLGFPGGSDGKASACNVGDPGSIPGSGRSPGEGNGNLLQYSCLENSMDGGAWWATVHGVKKSWTRLSNLIFTFLKFYIWNDFNMFKEPSKD